MTSNSNTTTVTPIDFARLLAQSQHVFKNEFKTTLDISSYLIKFLKDEEYNEYGLIREDLDTDPKDSELVDSICSHFNFNHETIPTQSQVWHALRIIFDLEPNDANSPSTRPLMMNRDDWNQIHKITKKELLEARTYINKQCGSVIREKQDKAFLKMVVMQRKNKIPLISLLYDVYTKYRITRRMARRDKAHKFSGSIVTPPQFVKRCHSLSHLNVAEIPQTLTDFENRMNPKLQVNSFMVIEDRCEAFIDYTLMVSNAIANLLDGKNVHVVRCLPLQVDLVIIPKKVQQAFTANFDRFGMHDTDDDTDDSDDDDDDDDDDGKYEQNQNDGAFVFGEDIEKLLQKRVSPKITKHNLDPTHEFPRRVRAVSAELTKVLQGKSHRRITILIDRRTEPNQYFVYSLPGGYGLIPHDYCIEGLIFASGNCILPHENTTNLQAQKSPYIGAKFDAQGYMFVVSYQIMQQDRVRLQWFYNGGGMRFWPELMVTLWPSFFVKKKIENTYTKQYVEDKFRLNFKDKLFDSWYNTLLGTAR